MFTDLLVFADDDATFRTESSIDNLEYYWTKGLSHKYRKTMIIFLNGSLEYLQHMFWLINKKINF